MLACIYEKPAQLIGKLCACKKKKFKVPFNNVLYGKEKPLVLPDITKAATTSVCIRLHCL